jgi:NAD(P)-dependent dehydrogenase (short-subunit alcohol dehydrogenase family)
MRLSGKAAIVSGGASGLGAATVRMLRAAGAQVALADRNREGGERLAAETGALFVETDVTVGDSVGAAVELTKSRFGGLHIAVSCAGIATAQRTLGREGPMELDAFRRVIEVNLVGTFNVSRLAAAAMAVNTPEETGERGVIVNTASVAAFEGQIGQAAYSASKGGVVGMTLPMARDLMKLGIRVVAVAPGMFRTPLLESLPEAAIASIEAQVPFPSRLGDPSEYAQLVRHIVENPYLNGETIRLDGALRMGPK